MPSQLGVLLRQQVLSQEVLVQAFVVQGGSEAVRSGSRQLEATVTLLGVHTLSLCSSASIFCNLVEAGGGGATSRVTAAEVIV